MWFLNAFAERVSSQSVALSPVEVTQAFATHRSSNDIENLRFWTIQEEK